MVSHLKLFGFTVFRDFQNVHFFTGAIGQVEQSHRNAKYIMQGDDGVLVRLGVNHFHIRRAKSLQFHR